MNEQVERQLHLFSILGSRLISTPQNAYAYLPTLKKPKNQDVHSVGYIIQTHVMDMTYASSYQRIEAR
jgi:hypothetical protein